MITKRIFMLFMVSLSLLISSCEMETETTYTITGRLDYATMPAASTPVVVIAASTMDYDAVLSDPLNNVYAMSTAETDGDFVLDLTGSSATSGTEIFLFALADEDYNGTMPALTTGDLAGFYMKNDPSDPAWSIILSKGNNNVTPSGDWQFALNRSVRDFTKYIQFELDPELPDSSTVADGDKIFVYAVEETGLNGTTHDIEDLNYVVAMEEFTYNSSEGNTFSIKLMDNMHTSIADPNSMSICLYVIHDTNGDGTPSTGDEVATYWQTYLVFFKRPKLWAITADETNELGETVEFIDVQF